MDRQNSAGTQARLFPRLTTVALWLIPATTLSVVLARVAVWMQREGYVSALSPIVLGAVLGAISVWLARKAGISSRGGLLIGILFLAIVCVASEHLMFYVDYRAKIIEAAQRDPKLQMIQTAGELPLPTFAEFIRSQASVRWSPGGMPNWLWWIIDGGLTIVTSVAVAWFSGGAAMQGREREASSAA